MLQTHPRIRMALDAASEERIRAYLPSNAVLSNLCDFFSVFTDVTRMKILSALSMEELCVTDLAGVLDLNQTTVSHQLHYLRNTCLVSCRRQGKILYYSARSEFFNDVLLLGASQVECLFAASARA